MFSLSSILTAFKSNDYKDAKSQNISSGNDIKKTEETPKSNDETSPEEKKPSPCCCCKPTKQARDACIVENGAENCTELIEAHKACMRSYGYEV